MDIRKSKPMLEDTRKANQVTLLGKHTILFVLKADLLFDYDVVPTYHPNCMKRDAFDASGMPIAEET